MNTIAVMVVTRFIFFLEVDTNLKRKITECVFYNYQARVNNADVYERYKMCLKRYKVKE